MKKYNSYTEIKITMQQLFGDVFPEGIPNNAYVDKSKTALGITHSEFHAQRNSIIVVPTRQIIKDKALSYASLKPFELHGEKSTKNNELNSYLMNTDIQYKKIVTTPDSFGRIITAAREEGILDEILNTYFCFLDEVHCYATERFRRQILTPFIWFWKFKFKAVGSATPYNFSDQNFHRLDYFKLKFEEKFGIVNLIIHEDTVDSLALLLSNLDKFEGNIHIFLNSIDLINRVVNKTRLRGNDIVAIFCAQEERNSNTLADNNIFFRSTPKTGHYAKVNFYSTKFNEGWDLVDDEKCTFILATDVRYKHSLAFIHFKGFQAIGRLRSAEKIDGRPKIIRPHTIYHVTNTFPINEQNSFKNFETVEQEWTFEAKEHVAYYNAFVEKCKDLEYASKGLVEALIGPFADFKEAFAVVNLTKVDQNVCEEYSLQFYNSESLIKQAWVDMNYEVVVKKKPEDIKIFGENTKTVNKRIIEMLESTKRRQEYDERLTEAYFRKLSKTHKSLFLSYHALGAVRLKELGYDNKKMQRERLKISNDNSFKVIGQEIRDELKIGEKYAKSQIKEILQTKYIKHGIYNDRNKIKVANLNDMTKEMSIAFKSKGKVTFNEKTCPAIIILARGEDSVSEIQ